MKFLNNGEEFVLVYNSKDHKIPKGEFEVNDDDLGNFIIYKATNLKLNINCLDATAREIEVAKVEPSITKEEVKEEKKEEVKEEKEVKKGKK